MDEHKHMWYMVLACGVPMLILLLLPAFGVKGNYAWLTIILMVALHIPMLFSHSKKPGKKCH